MDMYITEAELRVFPYNISQEEANDKYLTMLQDLTRKIIDKECGQEFSKEGADPDFVEYKTDGTGKDTVFLPVGKRLLTLNSVRIYVGTLSYNDYSADNFYAHEKYVSWKAYGEGVESGRFAIEDFPKGSRNIGIVGEWGWETVPEPIKYLQGRLIQKILREGSLAQKFSQEQIGDYNYKVKEMKDSILGEPELDMIIEEYRHWSFYYAI